MHLRLDVVPIVLPQVTQADPPSALLPLVNCLLHSGSLPPHHYLEVQLNDVPLEGIPEGEHLIFTWQFHRATDEAQIRLLRRGVEIHHWRGRWNGSDALLHKGTLPIQVVLNGKFQLAATELPIAATLSTSANGHSHIQTENQATAMTTIVNDSAPPHFIQNMLIVAEPLDNDEAIFYEEQLPKDLSTGLSNKAQDLIQKEQEFILPDEEDITLLTAKTDIDTTDQSERARRDEAEKRGDPLDEQAWENRPSGEQENISSVEISSNMSSLPLEEALPPEITTVSTGPQVAVFYARLGPPETTLQALQGLVAQMPSPTIIVDLRHQGRRSGKNQTLGELTRETLRAAFGARYTDRGWAIRTNLQPISALSSHAFRRWQEVVISLNHPDGFPALLQYYQQGYSLILMDNQAIVEESTRWTVLEALRQRLPNLQVRYDSRYSNPSAEVGP
ncbi:MAG: hypothetical protein J2P37_35395 [Ktedonobacteraceae bacterium]|nr:hypothetical protein [Ktedonobacteraceae bacterium]